VINNDPQHFDGHKFGGGDNLLAGYQVRAVAERLAGTFAHKSKRSLVKIWHFHLSLCIVFGRATPAKNEDRQSAGRRWAACSHNSQGARKLCRELGMNATFAKCVCGNNWPGRFILQLHIYICCIARGFWWKLCSKIYSQPTEVYKTKMSRHLINVEESYKQKL